ncbi:GAF domain-containing protein [Neobacillus notoginsengisoli]|uniref:histidine kinase n=1 Tax=Neobacillus notoginsengisoli TaxID=1578198 RepID=A0A417YL67_9BACI|nr:GAF domain-containing sensor histidine kinase [Neobacillus notoginsengisoli]RHW34131.1 GAF domain-containing protein [Neobacillus notoginsengisoli]
MDAESRLQELGILKEIAELLNKGKDTDEILSDVLAKLLHVTGLKTGWIFLIGPDGFYTLSAKKELPEALSRSNFAPMCSGDCWCIERYTDGRLDKATNIIECKRLEDAILNNLGDTGSLTHHATVPLRAGDEKFGLLNVGSPHKTHFDKEELALLESVALQIGSSLKRIKLAQQEQELALTAERNRLARDLHDSVNQLLFSVSLTAKGGAAMAESAEIKETFSYIQELAQEALNEMRALIWQLKPRGLENGIVSALRGYAQMLGLELEMRVKGIVNLPGKIEEGIWRIGQEAMANCKKHSGQDKIVIELAAVKNNVVLEIRDPGCGFHFDEKNEMPSLGLKSMKDRTEGLDGQFWIESTAGAGTRLIAIIPI